MAYQPNYPDLLTGGVVGYLVGKFGDVIIKSGANIIISIKRKILFKEINKREFSSILALDHAEAAYELSDIKIKLTPISLYYSPSTEFKDRLINLFSAGTFKNKDYGLSNFKFSKILDFNDLLEKNKKIVSKEFIDSATTLHPLFNGQKLGIYDLKIKRVPDSARGILSIDLFKTDYFTHKVSRQIYRFLNSVRDFSTRLNIDYFNTNFDNYKFLNTSLGIYIAVQIDEGFIFCKRSTAVSNSEEAGKWHISVDEGLDVQDLNQGQSNHNTIDMVQFATRGLREELGLSKGILDKYMFGKIRFLDVFLETKRYELIISAHVKLNISFIEFKKYYETAKDARYETTDIICIEDNNSALEKFFKNYLVTDMAKYCMERIMYRERV